MNEGWKGAESGGGNHKDSSGQEFPDNFYDRLGVSQNATEEDIKTAFRNLAKEHHPEAQDGGNVEKFKRISEAYNALKTPEARANYDARSTRQTSPQPPPPEQRARHEAGPGPRRDPRQENPEAWRQEEESAKVVWKDFLGKLSEMRWGYNRPEDFQKWAVGNEITPEVLNELVKSPEVEEILQKVFLDAVTKGTGGYTPNFGHPEDAKKIISRYGEVGIDMSSYLASPELKKALETQAQETLRSGFSYSSEPERFKSFVDSWREVGVALESKDIFTPELQDFYAVKWALQIRSSDSYPESRGWKERLAEWETVGVDTRSLMASPRVQRAMGEQVMRAFRSNRDWGRKEAVAWMELGWKPTPEELSTVNKRGLFERA